ncbi:MAG: FMN-binding protein [Planctomycetaceae bacterium]|nr:FMN-binding protein [Planctomycetaceae bacterium]
MQSLEILRRFQSGLKFLIQTGFRCHGLVILLALAGVVSADDGVTLSSGSGVTGKVTLGNDGKVTVETLSGTRTVTRTYPKSRLKTYTIDGVTYDAKSDKVITTPTTTTTVQPAFRSQKEVVALIGSVGSSPPDWFSDVPLSVPRTLDLSWPHPPKGPWDSSKNIGQYIWDRVNPNPSRWREGIILLHHVLQTNTSPEVRQRAMRSLGSMYHNLHQDYPRSAYWFLQSGLEKDLQQNPQAAIQLADCYFHMGSREMALDLVNHMRAKPYSTIKLLGDLGETDQALKLASQFSRTGEASTAFLYAGDVCRVANRLSEAEDYYRQASAAATQAKDADKPHRKREKSRAEASLAVVRLYSVAPANVKTGTYTAASPGYEADVKVEVVVANGKMTSLRVTEHREKQFYASVTETPARILARQSIVGIDATTGATITSEAIINATARALANGSNSSSEAEILK